MDITTGKQGAGPREIRVEGDRLENGLYVARGPEFYERFLAQFVMPRRFETAQMVVAQILGSKRDCDPDDLAHFAFKFADALILAERETLDAAMGDYWDLYLSHKKSVDEVMRHVQDMHQDYSL